jgi:hypothetical protein
MILPIKSVPPQTRNHRLRNPTPSIFHQCSLTHPHLHSRLFRVGHLLGGNGHDVRILIVAGDAPASSVEGAVAPGEVGGCVGGGGFAGGGTAFGLSGPTAVGKGFVVTG